MKIQNLLFTVLLSISFFNCNTEDISNEELNINPNFRVVEAIVDNSSNRETLDDPCMTVSLIAGQHIDAGTVTVDADDDDLIITYKAHNGFGIKETHLSVGNCDIQSIPTTGSDNPKIGRFEHSSSHNNMVNEVTYYISKDAVEDIYCFAAHAVVENEVSEETAWAEGYDFGGNNWAMYVEANLSDCDVTSGPTGPVK